MESNPKAAATFYQYRLIKKANLSPWLIRIYMILILISMVLQTVFLSPWSPLYILLAAPVIFWIQYVVSRSVLLISGHPIAKRWKTSLRLPWLGYMPDQYISYRTFRKVQMHNFWIGLCIAALFVVWSPPAFTVSMVICHLWLLLPRLYALFRFNNAEQEGMLKFSSSDISYYAQ